MRKIILAMASLTCFFLSLSCGGGGGSSSPSGKTDVTIRIGETRIAAESAGGAQRTAAQIPAGIVGIRFIITGPGMSTVDETVPVQPGEEIVRTFVVPNGPDRIFQVEALNAADHVDFIGETESDLTGVPLTLQVFMQPTAPVFAGVSAAVPVSSTEVDVSWPPATDNDTPTSEIVYLIYYAQSPGGQDFSTPNAESPPGATSVRVAGLVADRTYYFVVRARDRNGNISGNTGEAPAQTLPIPNPSISVEKGVSNSPEPGLPCTFFATVTNRGNEVLNGVACVDTPDAPLSGVPGTLSPGQSAQVTGSYVPATKRSVDTLSCSGIGARSGSLVSNSGSATCEVSTRTAITVVNTCTAAPAPGQPNSFSATVRNDGNETLNGVSCNHDPATPVTPPPSLGPGETVTVSGSYVPSQQTTIDTLTCRGTGVLSGTTVESVGRADCTVPVTTALTVEKTCGAPPAPGQPITFSARVTNTGTERLSGLTCFDVPAATLTGVPAALGPGEVGTVTGSYLPTTCTSSDTLTCTATGDFSRTPVRSSSSATCPVNANPLLTIAKSCSVHGELVAGGLPSPVVDITANIANAGNETVGTISCTDVPPATFTTLIPQTLAPGGSAQIGGTYRPSIALEPQSFSDTLTCSGRGAVCGGPASGQGSATCSYLLPVSNVTCTTSSPRAWSVGGSVRNDSGETVTNVQCFSTGCPASAGVSLTPGQTLSPSTLCIGTPTPANAPLVCTGVGATTGQRWIGRNSAPCSVVLVNPTTLDFASVCAIPLDSVTNTITIRNLGSSAGLTVTGISIIPSSATEFAVSGFTTPFTIAPGDFAPINVTYTPADLTGTAPPDSATLRITTNDPVRPIVDVPLSGSGINCTGPG